MIKKLNLYLIIFTILMIVFGLLYTIIANIVIYFKKVEPLELVKIKSELVDEKLVRDHNTYYSLGSAFTNLTDTMIKKEYDEIYNLIDVNYKKAYTKASVKDKVDDMVDNKFIILGREGYSSPITIKNAYMYNDFYIVSFIDIQGKELYFAIKLDLASNTYTFTFVE